MPSTKCELATSDGGWCGVAYLPHQCPLYNLITIKLTTIPFWIIQTSNSQNSLYVRSILRVVSFPLYSHAFVKASLKYA